MSRNYNEDLFKLAKACLLEMELAEDYPHSLQQNGKRPFGNSGQRALIDTLSHIDIHLPEDIQEDEMENWLNYARDLWEDLPKFIKTKCELILIK